MKPRAGRGLEVVTTNLVAVALSHGRLFYATTGRLTAGTNENIRILFGNPAGSGKQLLVVKLAAVIGPDQITGSDVYINPDTGLPATAKTPFNAAVGHSYASVAEFKADTSTTALSGGTATDLEIVNHKGRNTIDALAALDPGVSLGVNIPLGVLATGDGAFAIHYVEQDK